MNELGKAQKHMLTGHTFNQKWIDTVDRLELSGGKLDLLTDDYGGFRFSFDGQMRKAQEKDEKIFQINISASQKQLSTKIKINGSINKNDGWHMDAALERSRLDIPDLQLTRVSGQITGDGRADNFFTNGALNIGGFEIGDLAWGDIAMTFEQSAEDGLKWVIAGNALRSKDVEFGLNYNEKDGKNIHGTLYSKDLNALLNYLNDQGNFEHFKNTKLSKITDVFITYTLPFSQFLAPDKQIIFNFKKIEENIDVKGKFLISNGAFKLQGLLSPQIVQNLNISNSAKIYKGNLSGAVFYNSETKDGRLETDLNQGILQIGPLFLTKINTKTNISDIANMASNDLQTFSFSLPFKKDIEHEGNASYLLREESLTLENINLNFFDGSLLIPKADIADYPSSFSFQLKNLDLEKAVESIGLSGLIDGVLQGAGDLSITKNNELQIGQINLETNRSGRLQVPESILNTLFDQDNIEQETLRQALKNFRYEFIKIKMAGVLNGETQVKISAKGRNPDILGGRTMAINFQINKDLRPFWYLFLAKRS